MPEILVKKTGRKVNGVADGDGSPRSEPHREAHAPRTLSLSKADVPLFRKKVLGHLGYYDRCTLEQLAFLARRTVRNQGY